MDKINIIEGNKLIANFMDIDLDSKNLLSKYLNFDSKGVPLNVDILEYHKSWDWLITCDR